MPRQDLRGVSLTELVTLAHGDDQEAWNEIVRRFSSLVWRVAGSYRLAEFDRNDVAARTWAKLLSSLESLREPERLAGWLATVAGNEAKAVLRERNRVAPTDRTDDRSDPAADRPESGLVVNELRDALEHALAALSERCQQLLRLLACDPRPSYADISQLLGMPHGSIGPTQARCLDKLRRHPVMGEFLGAARR